MTSLVHSEFNWPLIFLEFAQIFNSKFYALPKNSPCIVCFCLWLYDHLGCVLKLNMNSCLGDICTVFPPKDYCRCPIYCKHCLDCIQAVTPLNSAKEKRNQTMSKNHQNPKIIPILSLHYMENIVRMMKLKSYRKRKWQS